MQEAISDFLSARIFAVAGVSRDPSKYGHKVFQALVESGRNSSGGRVYPINPQAGEIGEQRAYAGLSELPQVPESLSIVTPPAVTAELISQAIRLGVKNIWMQPGAENPEASQEARQAGVNVIDDGSCLLVALALEKKD